MVIDHLTGEASLFASELERHRSVGLKEVKKSRKQRAMVVTDLDGTLLRSDGMISKTDFEALSELGKKDIARVIATGRSLFSLKKVLPAGFPADYIIFSTGAGISNYPLNRLLFSVQLQAPDVRCAARILQDMDLDFSIQRPIPDNHRFLYRLSGRTNQDFAHRLKLYRDHCEPFSGKTEELGPAAQLIAILPPEDGLSIFSEVRTQLADLTVIRATSPLDHKSIWAEIFPFEAGKGKAVSWLAASLGVSAMNILAIGNDYNDVDMLEMAGSGFVVDNAPHELKSRYPKVASNDRSGVADAVAKWLTT